MSIFRGPKEHASNPPETWEVVNACDRVWHLRPSGADYPLETFKTKREAEAAKVDGWTVREYEKERRWYAGESIPGWRAWAELAPNS